MTTRRMLAGAVAVLFAAAAVVSCDEPARRPTPLPFAPSPGSPAPSAPLLFRVEVAGGPVAPGASTQYSATGHYGDGTSRDVTREATWAATAGRLSVSPEGLVTGVSIGTGDVRAVVRRPDNIAVTGVKTVHVVPFGTFRIAGRVTEVGAPTFGLSGARVRVEGEPSVGEDVTNELGQFALYGVPSPATIVASREGYGTARVRVTPTEHHSVFLELPLEDLRPIIEGRYTFRLTPSQACAGTPLAAARTYSAVVTQAGPRVRVLLGGATFHRILDRFSGIVDRGQVVAPIKYSDEYDSPNYAFPTVAEIVAPDSYFVPFGTATLHISSTGLAGPFDGALRLSRFVLGDGTTCLASDHRIEMTR